jgi:anaerobic selenocysteine-containing dehydrogenase
MGFERGMRFMSAAEIFDEFARSTAGRPNDQSALHHELLRRKGPQHWPYPALGQSSQRRYALGQFPTASGRARFWAHDHQMLAERTDAQYPLILTTGRLISHWHTRTKTGLVRQLNEQAGQSSLSMHPADAQSLSLRDGQAVRVISRRGETRTRLRYDSSLPPGTLFMPIHFNDLFAPGASPNEATTDAADPTSRQPALKYCAVRVEGLLDTAV